jgi:hypothetical protein
LLRVESFFQAFTQLPVAAGGSTPNVLVDHCFWMGKNAAPEPM